MTVLMGSLHFDVSLTVPWLILQLVITDPISCFNIQLVMQIDNSSPEIPVLSSYNLNHVNASHHMVNFIPKQFLVLKKLICLCCW